MRFTKEQKKEFCERGFLNIPGAVSPFMVNRARKAIHHSLGEEGMNKDNMDRYRGRSYCPEIQGSPEITDLFNGTPLKSLAESALEPDSLMPVKSGQIALRFPTYADSPPEPSGHIDGADYNKRHAEDKVPDIGHINPFTMFAVILLDDVPEPNSGNFTVWPGSHHILESYFREHGTDEVAKPGNISNIIDELDWPEPHQTTGLTGDAFLTHYQVAHGVAPNVSPNIRYAAIFRLRHRDLEQNRDIIFGNIWLGWEGMKEVIEKS